MAIIASAQNSAQSIWTRLETFLRAVPEFHEGPPIAPSEVPSLVDHLKKSLPDLTDFPQQDAAQVQQALADARAPLFFGQSTSVAQARIEFLKRYLTTRREDARLSPREEQALFLVEGIGQAIIPGAEVSGICSLPRAAALLGVSVTRVDQLRLQGLKKGSKNSKTASKEIVEPITLGIPHQTDWDKISRRLDDLERRLGTKLDLFRQTARTLFYTPNHPFIILPRNAFSRSFSFLDLFFPNNPFLTPFYAFCKDRNYSLTMNIAHRDIMLLFIFMHVILNAAIFEADKSGAIPVSTRAMERFASMLKGMQLMREPELSFVFIAP